MIQDFFLPISMVMGFATYDLIARWYVMPRVLVGFHVPMP